MSKGKELLKNTAIVSIGKICTQLITFFLLPVYTAVLSNEEYGVVDLLNTLTSLMLPIATLQIEQGIFRYLVDCREDKEKQTTLITTILRFTIIQTIICILIFLCISPFIHNQYKYYLMANLLMGIFSTILLQICRGLGDNTKYAIGSFNRSNNCSTKCFIYSSISLGSLWNVSSNSNIKFVVCSVHFYN